MNAHERYEVWLALVRGELSEAEAASRWDVEVTEVRRLRLVAEQAALQAIATTTPAAPARVPSTPDPADVTAARVRRLLARSPEFVGASDQRLDELTAASALIQLGDRAPLTARVAAGPLLVAQGTVLALGPDDRPVDLIGRGAYRPPGPGRRLVPLGTTHLTVLPAEAARDAGSVARRLLATGAPLGGPPTADVTVPAPVALGTDLGGLLRRPAAGEGSDDPTTLELRVPPEAGLAELLATLDHGSFETLTTVPRTRRSLARWLLTSGTDITAVGRLLAEVDDRLMRRLLVLATSELGPPPGDFAWLVFGSQARHEPTLTSDQDTGLVYEAGLDAEGHRWYATLGAWMTDALERCGRPRCPGGVMASEPAWRHDLEGWDRTIRRWTHPSDTSRLVGADIGLDVRAVAGTGDLGAQSVQDRLGARIADASRSGRTTARLARAALARRPPTGLWGRAGRDPLGPTLTSRQRRFDPKRHGIQPIVDLARLHTLLRGGTEVNTTERLAAAAADGTVPADLAASLVEGLRLLTWVRMSAQLADAGAVDDDHVDWTTLPVSLRNQFGATFTAIRSAQSLLRSRYPLPTGP